MSSQLERIAKVIELGRPIAVADIGANPIDGEPPYTPLVEAGLGTVTGFEPLPSAFQALEQNPKRGSRYLQVAVGDGETHRLHCCKAEGMTSLLEPDPNALALFDFLRPLAEVQKSFDIPTVRLDDVSELGPVDWLKMDVQGAELMILRHGIRTLSRCSVVQLEVPFVTLYKGQPTLGEVDCFMREQGFLPHCFAELKQWILAPCVVNNDPRIPMNQLLEADLVYVRDIRYPDAIGTESLKSMGLIAVAGYGSIDLALRCVALLESRGVLAPGAEGRFLETVTTP